MRAYSQSFDPSRRVLMHAPFDPEPELAAPAIPGAILALLLGTGTGVAFVLGGLLALFLH